VFVPGKNGSVANVTCSKAFFRGMDSGACPWSDGALHLALPISHAGLPLLDIFQQSEIADRFQPRLLMHRLRNFQRVRQSATEPSGSSNPTIARTLAACVEADNDIVTAVTPLLQAEEQDAEARRGCDIELVTIEAMWVPSHGKADISVTDIREWVNCLLRERGEIREFSSEEVGWKLRSLGFHRDRNGNGMLVRFSRENRARIHELGRFFRLDLPPVSGCPHCVDREVIDA
jgi:hypothetical protein